MIIRVSMSTIPQLINNQRCGDRLLISILSPVGIHFSFFLQVSRTGEFFVLFFSSHLLLFPLVPYFPLNLDEYHRYITWSINANSYRHCLSFVHIHISSQLTHLAHYYLSRSVLSSLFSPLFFSFPCSLLLSPCSLTLSLLWYEEVCVQV